MLPRRTEKFLSGLKSPLLGRQRTAVVVRSVPVCLDWGKTLGDHTHHGQLTGEIFSSILTRQQTILNPQNLLFLCITITCVSMEFYCTLNDEYCIITITNCFLGRCLYITETEEPSLLSCLRCTPVDNINFQQLKFDCPRHCDAIMIKSIWGF